MEERMSKVCDEMAQQKKGSFRKSDDAIIDVSTLGPVYCDILRQRRGGKSSKIMLKKNPIEKKDVKQIDSETKCKMPKIGKSQSMVAINEFNSSPVKVTSFKSRFSIKKRNI